ncbi:anti-sigma factor antagonist [Bacteroidetes/Chlorobi group bacterium MS-B_bin-24]|jgi:anti-sigma B factor antagonist|nr:MAG: anti-sigma factor antagonist [Bacteroidetes/Chlorobi group bacterium MS-B_bin-24]
MNLIIEQRNEVTIIKVNEPKIVSENSSKLKAKLLIEAQPDIKALLIDISKVETIDSSGFGAFLLADRQLRDKNIPTIIVGAKPEIYKLFEILKLDRVFGFADTIEEVLNEFS